MSNLTLDSGSLVGPVVGEKGGFTLPGVTSSSSAQPVLFGSTATALILVTLEIFSKAGHASSAFHWHSPLSFSMPPSPHQYRVFRLICVCVLSQRLLTCNIST